MTLIADLIRAGVAPDLVDRVADAIATARSEGAASAAVQALEHGEAMALAALDARRANDRDRKARQRHVKSREVTGSHVKSREEPFAPSPQRTIKPPHPHFRMTGSARARARSTELGCQKISTARPRIVISASARD